MNSRSLIFTISIIVMLPDLVWAQATVESIPNIEPSTTFIKQNFLNKFFSAFIFASIGAIVIASAIWYNIYNKKHQHPYKFIEAAEKSATQYVEKGNLEEAISVLKQAVHTIENDPKKFPLKSQSRIGAIWMLKRKITELNELKSEH